MLPAPPCARRKAPAPLRRHRLLVTLYFCRLEPLAQSIPGGVRPRYTTPSLPISSNVPGWEGGDGLALPHWAAFSIP